MTAAQRTAAIAIKPIYSGPRPEVDRQAYEAQCCYLETLAKSFSLHFYGPRIETDPRINQLFKEASELRRQCEAFAEKVSHLRTELAVEAGEGTSINDAREILELLPPHRITSGPLKDGYYNRVRFKLAFPPKNLPAIAPHSDISQYALKQAIDTRLIGSRWVQCTRCSVTLRIVTDDDHCKQCCSLPMVAVADPYQAARLEYKALEERLLPLQQRGFGAWIKIEKVTKANILATLVVTGR